MLITDSRIPRIPIFFTPTEMEEFMSHQDSDVQQELTTRWNTFARREITRINYLSKQLSAVAYKYKADNMATMSKPEQRTAILLGHSGIRYEQQHIIYTDTSFYIVDFYLPEYHIVIEVNGDEHYTKLAADKDARRMRYLYSKGYSIRTVTNKQALAFTPELFKEHILPDIHINPNESNTTTDRPADGVGPARAYSTADRPSPGDVWRGSPSGVHPTQNAGGRSHLWDRHAEWH